MPPHREKPARAHPKRARRLRRALACAVTIGGVLLTTAPAGHADPYAAPGPAPSFSAATLGARYQAERAAIREALRTAGEVGDTGRARALTSFLGPSRHFLYFDARGRGQAVEVIGDLAHARRIAVLVPGADSTLADFDRRAGTAYATPGGGARAVYAQAARDGAAGGLAVVAWLGYAAPKTISSEVLTAERADQGAVQLQRFLAKVHRANAGAGIALLCHSYGSVVCGRTALAAAGAAGADAAGWRAVTDIALFGSPGTTAWSAAALGGGARVWAGRGATDWMEDVPHVRILGLGLGPDPVSRRFGARVFDAGHGGHSDYLKPGSVPLRNLTGIALGHDSAVTSA
ncbi:alpha/beta hydrolase [Actinomadura parmotrematis]|uniref:Alpha/beta hydrolase family protein n=1 Tax=Actinomadura parmotrematis TaxID=2864039 RepID=A0ABS7FXE6_9ACTN|nr:alpha/beta hydrolase [Actinomadura parmotrematis]MBW8484840.1 alpha/beta hydrolase family protein [Actinomadura parmotrematis]